ncbi:MAG: hypothetical protein QOE92_2496, partial [Chloroflexota bacterium]|nr:hypothetical protein [Chloroflexota bacterium]
WKTGEDRRAFHLRHDDTEHPGFPLHLGSSGESSPAMADIEGRGWLDIILATADGKVHAIRPDGNEAPGFPVTMGLVTGMDPDYDVNYLHAPAWKSGLPRPHEESLGPIAVGDLRHDGGLEIVAGTLSGHTYAWDGAGHLLPGFPVLNGDPAYYHMAVPTPDTPYSFEPENYAGVPVLADLTNSGQLDIIQTAADNQVHAWHVTPGGVEAVPGWPVSTLLPAGTVPVGQQQTHDSKVVPTPAIADINGDGTQDVVVGLNDTILGTLPAGAGVKAFLMAYDGRGTAAPGGALLPGYPVKIQGLIQGYGVAQDFVTQGVESPVIYDAPAGPQAVVNANLFAPYRVDLATATPAANPFIPTTIPNATPQDCPPSPTGIPSAFPNAPGVCTLVGFTTSASVGNALGTSTPQVFQPGSAGVEVALGITQAPGFGVRVDNGIGGWDPATGLTLPQYSHYIQGLAFFTAPAIADVSGDGRPDILQATDSAALMGFDGLTGAAASGFPKWSGGFSLFTPAIGDLEGTGHVAVANMVREGDLHVWDTPGATSANHEAWHWHQDDRNTGHYGTDTRPPAAVRLLTVAPGDDADDLLTFTSPGDDWNDGTATTYQLVRSSQPITQANFKDATPVTIDLQPAAAGTKQQLKVPHVDGQEFYALRAVDDAGNIGPVRVVVDTPAVLPPAGPPLPRSLPNTAGASTGAGGGLLLGLAVAAFSLRRRRRRRAA